MIKAGILSDTHISTITPLFEKLVTKAFHDCDIIIHAGDMVSHGILTVFREKTVYAVHGNMCNSHTHQILPTKTLFTIKNYTIGLCHGAGPRHNIEDRMYNLFPEADCIIFGHTHQPLYKKIGSTLLINPGSFQCSSSFGAPASYAILTADKTGLEAEIHEVDNYA